MCQLCQNVLQLKKDKWCVSWCHLPQDFGTVVVVLHGVFDEAEAVNIADEGVAVGSEQVEPTHGLLKIAHRTELKYMYTLNGDVSHNVKKKTFFKHNFSLFVLDRGNNKETQTQVICVVLNYLYVDSHFFRWHKKNTNRFLFCLFFKSGAKLYISASNTACFNSS